MTNRARLPNRRRSESIAFTCNGMAYVTTISRFANGDLAEIFLSNHKVGSDTDTAARDSAVVASIALQHGVHVDTIRRALLRNQWGAARGPLGTALDLIARGSPNGESAA
jgi:hypothetical protein